ncbi:MAG: metalloregulator ArsR/SmtB family transcription factor [Candidatus Doudnabacteria bacterium]|nr:metalloregulator ArsR/SmtB family transcription factor [Candidatus Doudnabacteria bacterium]
MRTDKQIIQIRKELKDGTEQRVIFKILADTNRYRIFEMLGKQPQLTVSDMARVLKISLPLASQHLKTLERGGLLQKEKRGQKVYYGLRTDNRIAQAITKTII